jgi:hypothetical protein
VTAGQLLVTAGQLLVTAVLLGAPPHPYRP